MRKVGILNLIPSSYGGGAENLILEQTKFYNNKKFRFHIVSLREGNLEDSFKKITHKNKVQYTCLKTAKFRFIKNVFLLKKYIKKNNIKILHTHLIEADLLGFLMKTLNKNLIWITTKHATDSFRKIPPIGILDGWTCNLANRVIAVSYSLKKFLNKYELIPANKISVIHNGIDLNKFKKIDIKNARQKLNLQQFDFCVGIVGRIEKEKGHKFLIKAVSKLKKIIPNIKLNIIGTGSIENKLKELTERAGMKHNVKFMGYCKNVAELYPGFDLLILPSLFEGFGLVVIEAMAANVPVIVSNIDGLREIVSPKEGILIKPGSTKEICNAIIKSHKKREYTTQLAKSAKRKVINQFNLNKKMIELQNIYITLTKRNKK